MIDCTTATAAVLGVRRSSLSNVRATVGRPDKGAWEYVLSLPGTRKSWVARPGTAKA